MSNTHDNLLKKQEGKAYPQNNMQKDVEGDPGIRPGDDRDAPRGSVISLFDMIGKEGGREVADDVIVSVMLGDQEIVAEPDMVRTVNEQVTVEIADDGDDGDAAAEGKLQEKEDLTDDGHLSDEDVVVSLSDDELRGLLATERAFRRAGRRRSGHAAVSPEALITAESLNAYFKEIARIQLLTAEEEVDLSKRYQAGVMAEIALDADDGAMTRRERRRWERLIDMGVEAKKQMIASNLRLVVSIAKRYRSQGMPLIDLIQSGNIGLIRAVEKFDYTKGFKFSTYATWWIRQSVSRATADQSRTIRIPVHLLDSINKMKRVQQELSQRLNREPTVAEIAEAMGTSVDKVEDMVKNLHDASSLDTPVGEDEGAALGDLIEDQNSEKPLSGVDGDALHAKLMEIAADLDDREYRVIMCRYGLDGTTPMTLEAIGKEMGVTRERIRQIESKAIAKLRHPTHSKGLVDFMFMLSNEQDG